MSVEDVVIGRSPKLGDLVRINPLIDDDLMDFTCVHKLEVVEDRGQTIMARCLGNGMKHEAHKKYYVVVKTLEQRLEDNNMKPVMGLDR